jgi:hypothetical protein
MHDRNRILANINQMYDRQANRETTMDLADWHEIDDINKLKQDNKDLRTLNKARVEQLEYQKRLMRSDTESWLSLLMMGINLGVLLGFIASRYVDQDYRWMVIAWLWLTLVVLFLRHELMLGCGGTDR